MKTMSLNEIAKAIKAHFIQGNGEKNCARVSTDTRRIEKGDLFIALKGENFDAHDMLDKAIEGGAVALVVNREVHVQNKEIPLLLVEDTTRALQDLANYNRKQFTVPVIGVTGSNGKTSTKDIIASILSVRYKTQKQKPTIIIILGYHKHY
jgi:UDP-N-acetylmuramoyl-tripeptide--D-alanyl-D-alanine ligase